MSNEPILAARLDTAPPVKTDTPEHRLPAVAETRQSMGALESEFLDGSGHSPIRRLVIAGLATIL
ncbi:MAG TPA: HlyD family type I secretion periplasmic adaptor subunit, partial [Sinorhizobium sp.]|nr:HlyD family type I secretion periplasmic adaptor subunit [Sinorhizobium sp.]